MLGSTLPAGIGSLTSLDLLDLEENMLSGELFTAELLSLTNLRALRASFNQFIGTIPTEIGLLTELRQFWFAENMITSTIPNLIFPCSDMVWISKLPEWPITP
uniref:L domain-like protein n=1 Tax=Cyclophora tenuis TaxID=216820 RepID=A0A7S1GK75_CYCTE